MQGLQATTIGSREQDGWNGKRQSHCARPYKRWINKPKTREYTEQLRKKQRPWCGNIATRMQQGGRKRLNMQTLMFTVMEDTGSQRICRKEPTLVVSKFSRKEPFPRHLHSRDLPLVQTPSLWRTTLTLFQPAQRTLPTSRIDPMDNFKTTEIRAPLVSTRKRL